MLSHLFSRSRRTAALKRPAQKSPAFRLGLEALEAREVPATLLALDGANNLLRFDSATPTTVAATTAITGLGDQRLVGIDFRPRTGELIGTAVTAASANNSVLFTYRINPLTGAATFIGQTAAPLAGAGEVGTGYDFNPTVDRLRYVNTNDENARLNPNNGTLAGNDTDLTMAATTDIIGAAYDRNTDRQNNAGDTNPLPTTLYLINRATNSLAIQGGLNGAANPNLGLVADLGPLGFTLAAGNDGGFDIVEGLNNATNNSGLGVAYAALTANDNVTRLYTINLTIGAATVVGIIGAGATEIRSLTAVPDGVVVVGSGLGANGDVRLLDPTTGAARAQIVPFGGYQGGVRVAAGDVTRDGIPDAVVSATVPGGHVKVFDGVTAQQLPGLIGSFLPFQGFIGTVNVASGDVNRDGFADVLVVANGANGHVKAFSGNPADNGAELASFLSFNGFLGDATIAAADFNNDGIDEIVVAAAINGHVKVFNRDGTAFTTGPGGGGFSSFLAYEGFTTGPIAVAAGDVNGDGLADIVTIAGTGSMGHVKGFSGATGLLAASFLAFNSPQTSSPSIALADANLDGLLDIRVTPGVGQQANVLTFDLFGNPLTGATTFPAFSSFQGGSTIGGARF